jgi:hypothetical protein
MSRDQRVQFLPVLHPGRRKKISSHGNPIGPLEVSRLPTIVMMIITHGIQPSFPSSGSRFKGDISSRKSIQGSVALQDGSMTWVGRSTTTIQLAHSTFSAGNQFSLPG